MSTLSVTTVTSPDANTPLILTAANSGGGQIVLNAANTDIQFLGNLRLTSAIVGDGSGGVGCDTQLLTGSDGTGVDWCWWRRHKHTGWHTDNAVAVTSVPEHVGHRGSAPL